MLGYIIINHFQHMELCQWRAETSEILLPFYSPFFTSDTLRLIIYNSNKRINKCSFRALLTIACKEIYIYCYQMYDLHGRKSLHYSYSIKNVSDQLRLPSNKVWVEVFPLLLLLCKQIPSTITATTTGLN